MSKRLKDPKNTLDPRGLIRDKNTACLWMLKKILYRVGFDFMKVIQ